jgi:hypothetical protein
MELPEQNFIKENVENDNSASSRLVMEPTSTTSGIN